MISTMKRKIGATASGLVMLLTGAVASAQELGDMGVYAPPKEESGVCSVEYRGAFSLSREGRNHPKLATALFKRPQYYTPSENLPERLFAGVEERISEADKQLLQTKDDVGYLRTLASLVRDNILNLDQKDAHSQRMAVGYLNLLTRAIENRPFLDAFFRKCGGAPKSGYPSRNGGYNKCLGYDAFLASLEHFTGTPIDEIRKVSPLLDSLAIEHGQCQIDLGTTASYNSTDERRLRDWIDQNISYYPGVACGQSGDGTLMSKAMLAGLQDHFAKMRHGETIVRFAVEDEELAFLKTSAGRVYRAVFFDHDSVRERGTVCEMSSLPHELVREEPNEKGRKNYADELLDRRGIDVGEAR